MKKSCFIKRSDRALTKRQLSKYFNSFDKTKCLLCILIRKRLLKSRSGRQIEGETHCLSKLGHEQKWQLFLKGLVYRLLEQKNSFPELVRPTLLNTRVPLRLPNVREGWTC